MTGNAYQRSWSTARPGPGRGWYALAAAAALAGLVAFGALVVGGVTRFGAQIGQLERVDVPGVQQLYLDHPGSYTVYYETAGAPRQPPQSFQVDVTDPSGELVAVRTLPSGSETYQAGGHRGTAVAAFDAPRPGLYDVSVSADSPEAGSDVAVGRVNVAVFVLALVGGSLVGIAGVLVGTLIAVLTFVARFRARHQFV